MSQAIVESQGGVTLIGGGPVSEVMLRHALELAPRLVAADGGADRALDLDLWPEAVIGDLDSLSHAAQLHLKDRLHRIPEQITTDFDKALRHIAAPYVLALGFCGGRIDHSLAALSTLLAYPKRPCILLDQEDLIFLCPPELTLTLPVGTRVSLYPLAPVRGRSEGLAYPIDGLTLAPDGRLGTSNEASATQIHLWVDAPKLLVILPLRHLTAAISALTAAPYALGE